MPLSIQEIRELYIDMERMHLFPQDCTSVLEIEDTPPPTSNQLHTEIEEMISDPEYPSPIMENVIGTEPLSLQSINIARERLQNNNFVSAPVWNFSENDYFRTFDTFQLEKKKIPPKTPEERYKEIRKILQKDLGISKMSKKIDAVLKPYLLIRDEELLREVLNKTKDIRTYHDMRHWIEDYIITKRENN